MKKNLLVIITMISAVSTRAQQFHVNILGGVSNYGGDLQAQSFTFKQSKPAIALGMSYEVAEKIYIRGEYAFTHLGADDALSNNYVQLRRNLNFKTILQELDLLVEYDLLDNYEHQLVPYVFAGIGVFKFSPYTYDSLGAKKYLIGFHTEGQGLSSYPDRRVYKKTQVNIPLGAGVKFALSENIRVGAEISFRKLFTDYLDDVSTDYPDLSVLSPRGASLSYRSDELKPPVPFPGEGAQRGNPNIKDNYYFLMFRFSYRLPFGRDNGSSREKSRYHNTCPPVKL